RPARLALGPRLRGLEERGQRPVRPEAHLQLHGGDPLGAAPPAVRRAVHGRPLKRRAHPIRNTLAAFSPRKTALLSSGSPGAATSAAHSGGVIMGKLDQNSPFFGPCPRR